MDNKKLTNEQHMALWDDELKEWMDRPSPRTKLLVLLFLCMLSGVGLASMVYGIILLL